MSAFDDETPGEPTEVDYESKVGYGQPPKHTRWQKGFCPNPAGRPRKTRTRKYYLEMAAGREILVKDGRRRRKVTVLEAIIMIVKAKAIANNAAASKVHEKLCGLNLEAINPGIQKGVFLCPEKLTHEEWELKYAHMADGGTWDTMPASSSNEHAAAIDRTRESEMR